jgi:hypothetical protein
MNETAVTPVGRPSDIEVSMSVWLPIGRANFYSSTANGWLLLPRDATGTVPARSKMLDRRGYVPRLQVSVLRRVLEVLPVSFGYDQTAACVMNAEVDDLSRPVAVTLTLHPKPELTQLAEGDPERLANLTLAEAGVHEVTLHIDEHGGYTFAARARYSADGDVTAALTTHILEVFGGGYSLDRRSGQARSTSADNGGSTAVRRYNGVDPLDTVAPGRPRGILNFFQLNTIVEGLFNESLSPAVFFEQNDFLAAYLEQTRQEMRTSLSLIEQMRQVIGLLVVSNIDASQPGGLVIAMRRFLDVTAREVLQKLKWSVESVRRSLLDESVSMLHRQSKLVQLNLGALTQERTPELAEGASESQLRGYVMLAAAKLPLVANVHTLAVLAKDHLDDLALGRATTAHAGPARSATAAVPAQVVATTLATPASASVPATAAAPRMADQQLADDVRRLSIQLDQWKALLRGLRSNVRGLESAIEHAWRESLLYEQQQVRREQEAMAEIERSRAGRPSSERATRSVYNFLMLVLTAAAVLLTVKTGDILDINKPGIDWNTLLSLWPIAVVAVIFYLIVPLIGQGRRIWRDRAGEIESYPYEFTFRLQEPADAERVRAYLSAKRRQRRTSRLDRLKLTNRGGGRIERVSDDRALVKIHSIATFRVSFAKYARFEIVNEILAHRVSGHPTYAVVQCRIFGDSPAPLNPEDVFELIGVILEDVGVNLTTGDPSTGDRPGIRLDKVLELVGPLFADPTAIARIGNREGLAVPAPRHRR